MKIMSEKPRRLQRATLCTFKIRIKGTSATGTLKEMLTLILSLRRSTQTPNFLKEKRLNKCFSV